MITHMVVEKVRHLLVVLVLAHLGASLLLDIRLVSLRRLLTS
jgi:hypothetical protein